MANEMHHYVYNKLLPVVTYDLYDQVTLHVINMTVIKNSAIAVYSLGRVYNWSQFTDFH